MTSEVEQVELGNLVRLRSGYPFKSADWKNSGIPVIKIANIKGGKILHDGCGFVSEDVAQKAKDWLTEPGDVLIAMTGYVGELARVRVGERYLINQRVGRFSILSKSVLASHYLFYALQHPETKRFIEESARGSAQANLSSADIYKVKVYLHALEQQEKISLFLSNLDSLSFVLTAQSKLLEDAAQRLFRSWFVNFDPVHAKAAGEQPECMSPEIAALFPSEFEESELGLIPKGWKTEGLDNSTTYLNGLALQKYPAVPGKPVLPVLKIAQLKAGRTDPSILASGELKPDFIVNDGDIVFSWSGSLELKIWTGGVSALNQHLFRVFSNRFPKWFIYQSTLRHLQFFREVAASKATTMGHIQRHHLSDTKIPIPSEGLLNTCSGIFDPMYLTIVNNGRVIRKLEELRDHLLPRLISGQLSLEEAKEAVEEVVSA